MRVQHVRSLGFDGKWAVHPDQLTVINMVFTPTAEELARAKTVLDALDAAQGRGAVALDGEMIDEASRKLAAQVVSRARAAGNEGAPAMTRLAREPVTVGGPWFEDFDRGQLFDDAPGLTVRSGHAAVHQALIGDRLRLALVAALCRAVTGRDTPLVHPNLVCDVAIGQSTGPSRRVRGNLFYRGLVLARPVFVGGTLRTRTEIVGLKQNRRRDGAQASGLVAMRVQTTDELGEPVLDFWRCPMIPLRDPEADTGHADDFTEIPQELDQTRPADATPGEWRLDRLRAAVPGPYHDALEAGQTFMVEAGEKTVTGAPELARLTLNVATAHTDATLSPHGRRLVYGGHTISVAAAHATRAIPAIATIIAWRSCEHIAPVFEGDGLRTELGVVDSSLGGLVEFRARVSRLRAEAEAGLVLDWSFVAVVA
jgi:acyl dehydratase